MGGEDGWGCWVVGVRDNKGLGAVIGSVWGFYLSCILYPSKGISDVQL